MKGWEMIKALSEGKKITTKEWEKEGVYFELRGIRFLDKKNINGRELGYTDNLDLEEIFNKEAEYLILDESKIRR